MLDAIPAVGGDPAERMLGTDATPEGMAELDDLPRCPGVTGVGAGVADDGEPLVVLALAHADAGTAADTAEIVAGVLESGNLPRIEVPWHERLTVESVDVEGTLAVVTARPAGDAALATWDQSLYQRAFPPC